MIIWNLDKNNFYKKVQELTDHIGSVPAITYHHDSRRLFTGESYQSIIIWNFDEEGKKYEISRFLGGHTRCIHSLFYSPETKTLFFGNWGTIIVWEEKWDQDFETV